MKKSQLIIIATLGFLSACSWQEVAAPPPCSAKKTCPSQETEIFLQHPYTRVVARCYADTDYATDACAKEFERQGYVRFRNIPYKVARYDFLKEDTYPTRRWRKGERTPRW